MRIAFGAKRVILGPQMQSFAADSPELPSKLSESRSLTVDIRQTGQLSALLQFLIRRSPDSRSLLSKDVEIANYAVCASKLGGSVAVRSTSVTAADDRFDFVDCDFESLVQRLTALLGVDGTQIDCLASCVQAESGEPDELIGAFQDACHAFGKDRNRLYLKPYETVFKRLFCLPTVPAFKRRTELKSVGNHQLLTKTVLSETVGKRLARLLPGAQTVSLDPSLLPYAPLIAALGGVERGLLRSDSEVGSAAVVERTTVEALLSRPEKYVFRRLFE